MKTARKMQTGVMIQSFATRAISRLAHLAACGQRQHTSAYVSIRIWLHAANGSIREHTSAHGSGCMRPKEHAAKRGGPNCSFFHICDIQGNGNLKTLRRGYIDCEIYTEGQNDQHVGHEGCHALGGCHALWGGGGQNIAVLLTCHALSTPARRHYAESHARGARAPA